LASTRPGQLSALLAQRAIELRSRLGLIFMAISLWGTPVASEEAAFSVVDLHVDLPYRVNYKSAPFSQGSGQYRADHLIHAGVRGVVLPLFVPKDAEPQGRTLLEFERSYGRVFAELGLTAPYSLPGCAVGTAARGEVRHVETWLSFEDSGPIEPTSEAILGWILRGVRVFGIVHTEPNALATSSGAPSSGLGLSERGAKFIQLVWQHGGIVDVSHASDEATDDMIALARRHHGALIATHSNARALAPHPRNLTDAQLRALGELGGVVGVNFHGRFLEPKTGEATLSHVIVQLSYIKRVAGVGALAIGSDFEGGIRPPFELRHEEGFLNLARGLRKSGFAVGEIERIFSGNALRVLCGTKVAKGHAASH
jgi:membrane dipeptidase